MSRRTMLLLAAGAIAGGCSRDGPIVAPQVTEEAVAARQAEPDGAVAARTPATDAVVLDPIAVAIDDALGRLLPALGDYGSVLQSRLLKIRTNRSDKVARDELHRALDQLASTVPAAYRGDFDALRLELDAVLN